MSFTRDCYLYTKEVQTVFTPRNVFAEIRRYPKDNLIDQAKLFFRLLTYIDSAKISEWKLNDGSKSFDENLCNRDLDIALGYVNNPVICAGKLLAILESLSHDLSNAVRKDADYDDIVKIITGEVEPDVFFSATELKANTVQYLDYQGASGEKYLGDERTLSKLSPEQNIDILNGPSIKDTTRLIWDLVKNDETGMIFKRYKNKNFVYKALILLDYNPSQENTIIQWIRSFLFPNEVQNTIKKVDF